MRTTSFFSDMSKHYKFFGDFTTNMIVSGEIFAAEPSKLIKDTWLQRIGENAATMILLSLEWNGIQ